MSDYEPIACALHDEFEIAVLRARPVLVELQLDGDRIQQRVLPLDIRAADGEELLVYRLEQGGDKQQVRLDRVRLLAES